MTNKQFIKNLFRSGMVPMITQGAVDDFNEKYKKLGVKVTLQQVRKDRKLQEDVLLNYLDRYATEERLGHIPTPRDMARTLKGGPSGAKNNALVPYGNRIHDIVTSPRLLHPIG
jgi:hypothetical protein